MGNFQVTEEAEYIYIAQANSKAVIDGKAAPGDICDGNGTRAIGKLSFLDATWAMKCLEKQSDGTQKTVCKSSDLNAGPDADVENPKSDKCGSINGKGRIEFSCPAATKDNETGKRPDCVMRLILDLYDHDSGEAVKMSCKGMALWSKDLGLMGLSIANIVNKRNPSNPELFTFEMSSKQKKHNFGATFVPVFTDPVAVDDAELAATLAAAAGRDVDDLPF